MSRHIHRLRRRTRQAGLRQASCRRLAVVVGLGSEPGKRRSVVEMGTHDELLARGGRYASLVFRDADTPASALTES